MENGEFISFTTNNGAILGQSRVCQNSMASFGATPSVVISFGLGMRAVFQKMCTSTIAGPIETKRKRQRQGVNCSFLPGKIDSPWADSGLEFLGARGGNDVWK